MEQDDVFSIEQRDDEVVVRVSGEIDGSTVEELSRHLDDAIASARRCVLDLGGVTFLDSSGLQAIILANRRLRELGRGLVLRSPSATARRILQVSGLDQRFAIES